MLKNLILVEKWLKNPIWAKRCTPPGTRRAPFSIWRAPVRVSPFQIKYVPSLLSDVCSFTTGVCLFDQLECLLVHFSPILCALFYFFCAFFYFFVLFFLLTHVSFSFVGFSYLPISRQPYRGPQMVGQAQFYDPFFRWGGWLQILCGDPAF